MKNIRDYIPAEDLKGYREDWFGKSFWLPDQRVAGWTMGNELLATRTEVGRLKASIKRLEADYDEELADHAKCAVALQFEVVGRKEAELVIAELRARLG